VDGILVGNPNRKGHMKIEMGGGTGKLGILVVNMWTVLYLKTGVFKVSAISTTEPVLIAFASIKLIYGILH
jgi:hypothetical protein